MKNSSLRENILLQTAEYKCGKQNEIMRRYIFKSKRKGEENTPLPYTLLTKKISSTYFKRNMNQEVKITILNCEYMGVDASDILYRIKNYKSLKDHYPFDTKIDVLDFFTMTNKFINIYQILSDGSLKKINNKKKYSYNGQQVGISVTIHGTNCIAIEFYDDGKAIDYLVEILDSVAEYDTYTYNSFSSKYFVNGKYDETNNIISFVDGLLINPMDITKNSSNIEIITMSDDIVLNYDEIKVTNNMMNLFYELGYISDKLIIPYAYTNTSNNYVYKQYPNSVEKYSDYIPNTFKLKNYSYWLSHEVNSIEDDDYEENSYYIDSHSYIYLYTNKLNKIIYKSLSNGMYLIDIIDDVWNYNDGMWTKISANSYYIDGNNLYIYNNDTDDYDLVDYNNVLFHSSNKSYYDKSLNIIFKYIDTFKINALIFENISISMKSPHEELYNELMIYYSNDIDSVEYVMKETLTDEDTRILLNYPYYYKDILEEKVKDDLYIKTLKYIKKSQIVHVQGDAYIKFTFPIKSFSFMLFLNGKLLNPDIYEENRLDMNIYILASKVLNKSDIYEEINSNQNNHDSMSNYTHNSLSKMRHEYFERENYEFYYHNPNEIQLLSPLTIVRSKSFFTEANRFPLNISPLYLSKSDYVRYTFDPNLMYYTENPDGRYIKYNDRYYMISNYEYIYENGNFIKTDIDGDYYKIMTSMVKVPYNKHLENNLYNLIFIKEFNEGNSKVLENVLFDEEQANSNYPFPINENINEKYNKVIRAHCNEFLEIQAGNPSTYSFGMSIDMGDAGRVDVDYQEYDEIIKNAFSIIVKNENYLKYKNNILNIMIDSEYLYYITDYSYIYRDRNILYCKAIRYNIEEQIVDITDSISISAEEVRYLKYNLYTEENELVLERTDTRIHIDSGNVVNDNEKLISRALDNIENIVTGNYNNVAIQYNKIYFFKNENCVLSPNAFYVSKNCYTYDLITDSLMLSNGNNSYPQNIIYDDIEYLYKNIYNEDGTIAFWRKGYPRIYDNEKSIIMYNADIGYSKYYSSDDTLENKFEIPQQMVYNYDQIMLFANGYNVSEFLVNDQVWLENHIKIHDNDIFIANMPKLILYQTIEDLTLYSNMTIELLDNFNNSINRKCSYHHKYRKNVDIVHCPISLKYMAIFVNNIYMDENHVEILSDRRFMLKNLDDYPEIETKKMSELYPNDETDEIGYVINSIDIYCYPFTFDSMYSDYYEDKITYKDEYRNREYNEYPIKDLLYDKFMSELVSQSKKHCCNIIFEGDDIKDPQEYYLSDFRHYALSKFTHGELSRMKHDRLTDDGILSNYTHDELSKYTHNELSYFIYDNE